MAKRMLIILSCCFVFAIALVMILYLSTHKIVHERSSFLRVYQKHTAVESSEMDLKYNSYYIAGITADHIYLGNVTNPLHLLITNHTLTDSQHVKLRISNLEKLTISKSSTIKISPPYFYIADGHKPGVYRGRLGEWVAEPFNYDSNAYFTRLIPISFSSFAIRTNEAKNLNHILGKVQQGMPHIKLKHGLLQKQIDGVFCTDGMLQYNSEMKRLIYTYYYRNEYIVYDTSLNLDYRGHTIDTFSRAQVTIGHISSANRNKLIGSKFINLLSSTSGRYLFIGSNLMAKNDVKDWLLRQLIIDVYDLTNNKYQFSFTIPHYEKDNRAREFMIFDTKSLFALYDRHIIKYDLQPRYFSQVMN